MLATRLRRILQPGAEINPPGREKNRPSWVTHAMKDAMEYLDEGSMEQRELEYMVTHKRADIIMGGKKDMVQRGIEMSLRYLQQIDAR